MGDKTVSVRVRFEGGDQVKAGLTEVGREGTRAMQSLGGVSARTGQQLQNAGYQVSDFFVQVAGGTAPTRALAQQLPQLLQGLGLIGVAASVLVAALPSLWSLFSSGVDDVAALQKELDGVSKAVDAYGRAADLAIEPMDRLIAKYGDQAKAVQELRLQKAELARGEATRSINDLLKATPIRGDTTPFSANQLATETSTRQESLARLKAAEVEYRAAVAAGDQAQIQALVSEELAIKRQLATLSDVRDAVSTVANEYHIANDQASTLAVAVERVRESGVKGAAEQLAASSALRNHLVEIYGSIEAANQATSGLYDGLLSAESAAQEVLAQTAAIAGTVGAGADEAARLASNLAAASAAYSATLAQTGQASGPDSVRSKLQGGGVFTPPVLGAGLRDVTVAARRGGGGGGGGGGGADRDLARAEALTAGVRTETEKYALALEEVNRLKAKGLVTDETYNRQLEKLNDKLGETGDLGKQAASAIKGAFDGLFDDPAAALKNLSKQLAQMAIYAGLAKAFPSVFGAGGAVPLGIKGFASGGFHPGGLRIVGENGPELEATGPARIYPNSALRGMSRGGGGGTNVQVVNMTGQPSRTETTRGPTGEEMVRVLVGEEIARGGLDKSMRGRFGAAPQRTKR